MARSISSSFLLVLVALYLNLISHHLTNAQISIGVNISTTPHSCAPTMADDVDHIQFTLNLDFFEAEFLLIGATGKGLDYYAPGLSGGGPTPVGAQKAVISDPLVARIVEELGYQQIGGIRSIVETVGGIKRPLINLSTVTWGLLFDIALKRPLIPPFNPYVNTVNFLLAAYAMPELTQLAFASFTPNLTTNSPSLSLAAKLAPIKAGQTGVIRTLLSINATQLVAPYNITVREFTKAISQFTNDFAKCGIRSEGILLANTTLGAENRTTSNVLSADVNSSSYARSEAQILRIIYGSGNEGVVGGFFPLGCERQNRKGLPTFVIDRYYLR